MFRPHDDFLIDLDLVKDFFAQVIVLLQKFEVNFFPPHTAPCFLFFIEFVGLFKSLLEKFVFKSIIFDAILKWHEHFEVIYHIDDEWKFGSTTFFLFLLVLIFQVW